jgi:glycosyltransferase involved in cell wall biosynthesis
MHFVFISPIAWDNSDGAHRPVQFAQELARRGNSITYVEIEKSQAPVPTGNPRVLNLEQLGWDELDIVRAWYGFDYASPLPDHARWQAFLSSLPPQGIVIGSAPFRPALELTAALAEYGYATVYDVLDDIAEMRALGNYCFDATAERYLAQNADLVITLSPRLRQKFQSCPHVTLIRDGVDLTPFRRSTAWPAQGAIPPVPAPLARGSCTVGFWGTMWDYNLDVPLLQTVTQARPEWHWHFIGAFDLDPARPSVARALAAPNVHFHASVPRATLAEYARAFDVCMLPTPSTPFNLARDPLKVYEYLACYKPVVATNLEQLANMPHVLLSYDADEFLVNIERAAQEPIDHSALDAYLSKQTWAQRTDALLGELEGLSPHATTFPPPPRGAIPGVENELDRWQTFARHLERLVQERTSHIAALERALAQTSVRYQVKRALGLETRG